ncbi:MAG: class I SAM-dependent methyltransferase, partial [Amphiplicatus sp.]
IGCGTGRLSEKIIEAGARTYRGYDIAENAITLAQDGIAQSAFKDRIGFECADASSLPAITGDIVFSIGFLSWLTAEQIDRVFAVSEGLDFLHTITVRSYGYRQFLKWLHHLSEGPERYRVIYHNIGDIRAVAAKHGWPRLYVYRHRVLSPNVYVSSLPFPDTLGPQDIL